MFVWLLTHGWTSVLNYSLEEKKGFFILETLSGIHPLIQFFLEVLGLVM